MTGVNSVLGLLLRRPTGKNQIDIWIPSKNAVNQFKTNFKFSSGQKMRELNKGNDFPPFISSH